MVTANPRRKHKPQLRPRLLQGPDPRRDWWQSGSFQKYANQFALKHHWRCASWIALVDLRDDAYLCFLETCARYYWAIEQKHLMALYKRCMFTMITEKSYRGTFDQLCDRAAPDPGDPDCSELTDFVGSIEGDGLEQLEFRLLLGKLPKELKELLYCLLHDSQELLSSTPTPRGKMVTRETTNERFCRLVRLDPRVHHLAQDLRNFLLPLPT